jgi:hypothetical protein
MSHLATLVGMLSRVQKALVMSAACFGMTLGSANASETRQSNFLIPCDGTNRVVNLSFSNLGTASTRFVQSAEVTLFENNGGLQFILVGATNSAGFTDVFATLGKGDVSRSNQFTGFFSLPNTGGNITMQVIGACNGGGQIQGLVVIGFFS